MAGPLLFDRVRETTTTTGTGTLTLAGAVAGYQSFSVVGNSNTCYYVIAHRTANEWETGVGTYTSAGTTLARTKVIASSNSGSAVNLSAGTKDVFIGLPAVACPPESGLNNCRLTTESAVPVSLSDRTSQGTIYLTPYRGNRLRLYDGNSWRTYAFIEISLALASLTSGKNYDVFCYDNSGTLTLELSAAWTNDTTRADAIALQDGSYVKSGAATRLLVGTIRTTGVAATEDSEAKRFVWNAHNPVPRQMVVRESTDTWTYTSTTWRSMNAADTNRIEFVRGLNEYPVEAWVSAGVNSVASVTGYCGVGLDVTNASSSDIANGHGFNAEGAAHAYYKDMPSLGYHFLQAVERCGAAANVAFTGDNGTSDNASLSGIFGTVFA